MVDGIQEFMKRIGEEAHRMFPDYSHIFIMVSDEERPEVSSVSNMEVNEARELLESIATDFGSEKETIVSRSQ